MNTVQGNEHSIGKRATIDSQLDDKLACIVQDAVPSSYLISNAGTEMSFQLPIGESKHFIGMFRNLDDLMAYRSIDSYGVSVTTLEEVFQMVARGEEAPSSSTANLNEPEEDTVANRISVDDNEKVFKRHVQALFAKRAKNFKRDKKAW